MEALGRRFREARQRHGVPLSVLATRLGLCVNTIRWHEAGDRMLRTDQLVAAAAIIGCEPIDLIEDRADAQAA